MISRNFAKPYHSGVRQNSQIVKKGYTFVNQQKIQQV